MTSDDLQPVWQVDHSKTAQIAATHGLHARSRICAAVAPLPDFRRAHRFLPLGRATGTAPARARVTTGRCHFYLRSPLVKFTSSDTSHRYALREYFEYRELAPTGSTPPPPITLLTLTALDQFQPDHPMGQDAPRAAGQIGAQHPQLGAYCGIALRRVAIPHCLDNKIIGDDPAAASEEQLKYLPAFFWQPAPSAIDANALTFRSTPGPERWSSGAYPPGRPLARYQSFRRPFKKFELHRRMQQGVGPLQQIGIGAYTCH